MPQADADVSDLGDALTGPVGMLDPSGIDSISDPRTIGEALESLVVFGRDRLDLLLFYFAGHGLLGNEGQLCLALPGSVDKPKEALRTSLPANDVFDVLKHSGAQNKVAILDCCFSGRAFEAASAAGVHLLTATGRETKALYVQGERNTGFTRELLQLLSQGVPDGPEYLDLTLIYRRLAVVLPTTPCPFPPPSPPDVMFPTPYQRGVNGSGDLALARNIAYGSGRTRVGLESRAAFAQRMHLLGRGGPFGRPERTVQAAHLFEGIAADSARAYSPTDPDTLRYRHAHASLTGETGSVARAVRLLKELVADMSATLPKGHPSLRAAQSSLDHWRAAVSDAEPDTRF